MNTELIAKFYHRNPAHDHSYVEVTPGLSHVVLMAEQTETGARNALDRFLGLSAGTARFYGDFLVKLGDHQWSFSVRRPEQPKPIIEML